MMRYFLLIYNLFFSILLIINLFLFAQLVWFDLTNPAFHKPMYDTTIDSKIQLSPEVERLISLVFNEALNIQDRQQLLAELEKDPNMVHHIGLTPARVCLIFYLILFFYNIG